MLTDLVPLAREAKSWPFEQARALLNHVLKKRLSDAERDAARLLIDAGKADEALATFEALNRAVVLETGYGPSGLPHMGTFGEVARTTMVRNAFRALTGDHWPTRLISVQRRHGRSAQGPAEGVPNGRC
jgi:lysyl-tRNA synthetase class 1